MAFSPVRTTASPGLASAASPGLASATSPGLASATGLGTGAPAQPAPKPLSAPAPAAVAQPAPRLAPAPASTLAPSTAVSSQTLPATATTAITSTGLAAQADAAKAAQNAQAGAAAAMAAYQQHAQNQAQIFSQANQTGMVGQQSGVAAPGSAAPASGPNFAGGTSTLSAPVPSGLSGASPAAAPSTGGPMTAPNLPNPYTAPPANPSLAPGTALTPGTAAAAAALGGDYAAGPGAGGQSSLFGTLSSTQAALKEATDFGLGSGNNAQEQAMAAQAQDTGAYYSGVYNGLGAQAGQASATAAGRGTAIYQGDTGAYNQALNQSNIDRGMQTGAYGALNAFAANTPASAATQQFNNANASYSNLNQFAGQPLTYNAQGQLNSVGQSAGSLSNIGNSQFALNGQTQGQLAAVGQNAAGLTSFGNQIGTGPSAAAGNLANASSNANSMSQFGNSSIGPSAGAANLGVASGAANTLGAFGAQGQVNAAQQQFAQANQQYNNMQAFQAEPIGPSAAQQQLLQATDANTQNALAMARSGSGMGTDATALKQALNANAGTQQMANSQMAQLRANEYTAFKGQQLAAQGQAGNLAANMGNLAATQYDTQRAQNLQAFQSQGDLANTTAGLKINEQLSQQQQRQAALQAGAAVYDANGQLQIAEQNNNQQNKINAFNAAGGLQNAAAATTTQAQLQAEQNRINALNSAGGLQNQAAATMTSAQVANQQAQLAALTNAGQLANQTAGLKIGEQNNNQVNQLNALNAAGQLGTATVNSDTSRAAQGLAGAQYTTNTQLQGTQLNDATSQAWAAQQQAAYQQALAAEVGAQTQGLNINNAALAGRESEWSGTNSRYATGAGIASNQAIAQAAQTQAYVAAGLGAAGTIGAAALSSDENEKDVISPLGHKPPAMTGGPSAAPTSVKAIGAALPPPSQSQTSSVSMAPSKAAVEGAQHQAVGGAVGGLAGGVAGGAIGSFVGGPIGGAIGSTLGRLGGSALGKLIGSDVTNKTNIQPLSQAPGVAQPRGPTYASGTTDAARRADYKSENDARGKAYAASKGTASPRYNFDDPFAGKAGGGANAAGGSFAALQALAAQLGAGGVARKPADVKRYAAAKPSALPPLSQPSGNDALRKLTAPGMQGVGPTGTGNPGDDFLASSARAAPPSAYTYKNPNAPGSAPGMQVGPMAQDLAAHPVTAPAVGVNPATGKLAVDPGRLTLANTAQNHSQQNQLDSHGAKLDDITARIRQLGSMLGNAPNMEPGADDDPYGLRYGSMGYGGKY